MQQERNSLVLISNDKDWVGRCEQAKEFLSLEFPIYKSVQDLLVDDKCRPRAIVVDLEAAEPEVETQIAKLNQSHSRAEVLLIIPSGRDRPKVKTQWVVQKDEFFKSFMVEFFFFQKAFCEFLEIPPTDLFPDTVVLFNAYHFLPLNRKFFPLVHENFALTEKKSKKVESLKCLYIDRRDTPLYIQYIEKYFDQFKVGLRKRVKARSYQLLSDWRSFTLKRLFAWESPKNFLSENVDFPIWLNELMNYWRSTPDPWGLMFEISQLPYLRYDNSFLETSLACYFSRFLGEDEVDRILNLKAELASWRLRADSLLEKKWLISYGTEMGLEDRKVWTDYLSSFPGSEQKVLEESILKDAAEYSNYFISRTSSDPQDKALVHIYWGEVIASVFQKSRSSDFKKQDLLEAVMVQCKNDAILSESALEELRQFLLKEQTA